MEEEFRSRLKHLGVSFEETTEFESRLGDVDAIYMTRVQDEYDTASESARVDASRYHLKYEHLKLLKESVCHHAPLPRRAEIEASIDSDPRAKYWRQERNGMLDTCSAYRPRFSGYPIDWFCRVSKCNEEAL